MSSSCRVICDNLCYYWCENRGCDTNFCYIINLLQLEVKVKHTNDVPTGPGFTEGICVSLKRIFELFRTWLGLGLEGFGTRFGTRA